MADLESMVKPSGSLIPGLLPETMAESYQYLSYIDYAMANLLHKQQQDPNEMPTSPVVDIADSEPFAKSEVPLAMIVNSRK